MMPIAMRRVAQQHAGRRLHARLSGQHRSKCPSNKLLLVPLPARHPAMSGANQPVPCGPGQTRRFSPDAVPHVRGGVWGLPALRAGPVTPIGWDEDNGDIDWGEPSKEELVLDARLAREDVPEWARSMVLRDRQVQVHAYKGAELPASILVDAFDLTKANMEDMYLRSMWGWNDGQKRGDLESHLARFFVATDARGKLQGFIHYRFELIDNKFTHATSTAAYVLELQVVDDARRLGLGTLLMKAVEEIAVGAHMDSTMLCVFRYNEPAVNLYLNKMGYRIDQSSAFNDNQQDVWELVKDNPNLSEENRAAQTLSSSNSNLKDRWKQQASTPSQNLQGSILSPPEPGSK